MGDEELRPKYKEVTLRTDNRRKDMKELTAVEKAVAIPRKRRKDSEKLAALEEARIKVGQARDPREISNILGRLNVKKVTVAKGSPTGLWIASNKENALKPLEFKQGDEDG